MQTTEFTGQRSSARQLHLVHEASMSQLLQLINRVRAPLAPADFIEAVSVAFQEQQKENSEPSMAQRFRTEPSFHLFREALLRARGSGSVGRVCVLGCGQGFAGEPADFAADVVREVFGAAAPPEILVVNLTPSLLRESPQRVLAGSGAKDATGEIDLVVVHSFLHYVLDIASVFGLIRYLLNEHGGLILSHEPNARFWQNKTCQSALVRLRNQRRSTKFRSYLRSARTRFGNRLRNSKPTFWEGVNSRLKDRHQFADSLTESEIRRVVDIHRPEATPGNFRIGLDGFDFDEISHAYLPGFSLKYVATTGHLGYISSASLPAAWQDVESQLEKQEPLCGSVFTAHWRRNGDSDANAI
jgi:predicted TPR repeat methyltransferase